MPGLLGGRKAFEEGLSAGENAFLETLRAQIEPFTLRRTKQQVAQELPEKVEAVVGNVRFQKVSGLNTVELFSRVYRNSGTMFRMPSTIILLISYLC